MGNIAHLVILDVLDIGDRDELTTLNSLLWWIWLFLNWWSRIHIFLLDGQVAVLIGGSVAFRGVSSSQVLDTHLLVHFVVTEGNTADFVLWSEKVFSVASTWHTIINEQLHDDIHSSRHTI